MLAASDENRLAMAHLSILAVDHADCQRRELVLGHDIVPLGGVRYARRGILARKRHKIAKLIFTRSVFLSRYGGAEPEYLFNSKTLITAQK